MVELGGTANLWDICCFLGCCQQASSAPYQILSLSMSAFGGTKAQSHRDAVTGKPELSGSWFFKFPRIAQSRNLPAGKELQKSDLSASENQVLCFGKFSQAV
jgi:hypothetical protein